MSDNFSSNYASGIPSANNQYEQGILGWVNEARQEGERFLEEEIGFKDIDDNINYISSGSPVAIASSSTKVTKINRVAKVHSDIVSGLTDIKPLFAYQTTNPMYEIQQVLLNKLVKSWWINNDIDLRIASTVSWSITAGTGYTMPVWLQSRANGMGDVDLLSTDPRDIIPIRPINRENIQDAMGVIHRQVMSVNYVRSRYPLKRFQIVANRDGSKWSTRLRKVSKGFKTAIDRLTGSQSTQDMNFPLVDVYHVYVRDGSINTSGNKIPMGDPETNWFYEVVPGDPLYPRGRLIICTDTCVLSDGPNPYWHGQFPFCKLTLDPLPWTYIGKSVISDVIPINELLTEMVSKVAQAARKTLKPGVIADKNAVPETVLRNIDTEREGMKLKLNPVIGDGFKLTDPVEVPQYIQNLLELCIGQIDDLSGTRGLQDLMALKQLPSFDSIEKIQAAMTPAIRRRGRIIEAYLRNVAEQVKFNIFQFYTQRRRITLLGENGLTFEDFDFDPGNLIPAMNPDDNRQRIDRCISHINTFPFYVTPNSLLSIAQMSQKMIYMQLRRMGDMDHTSLLEVMEVPNISQVNARLSSELDQKIAAMTGAQEGRPPTAQKAPHQEIKGDGRPVVSES